MRLNGSGPCIFDTAVPGMIKGSRLLVPKIHNNIDMLPLKYRSARKLLVLVSLVLASLWLWNRAGDLLRVSKSAAWEESHRLMLQQL